MATASYLDRVYPFLEDPNHHVSLPAPAPEAADASEAASVFSAPAFENGALNWRAATLAHDVACRMASVVSTAARAAGLVCAAHLFAANHVRYDAESPMTGTYSTRYFRTQMSRDAEDNLVDGERVEISRAEVPFDIRVGLDEAIITQHSIVHTISPEVYRAVLDTFRPALEEVLRGLSR